MGLLNTQNDMRKELKIYGLLLLFLAALDVIMIILDLVFVDNSILAGLSNGGMIFIGVIYALSFLTIGIKIWMGRQALCYANGKGKGTSHIFFAKVAVVLFAIFVIVPIISWIGGNAPNMGSLISDIVSLTIVWSYMNAAKACLNQ